MGWVVSGLLENRIGTSKSIHVGREEERGKEKRSKTEEKEKVKGKKKKKKEREKGEEKKGRKERKEGKRKKKKRKKEIKECIGKRKKNERKERKVFSSSFILFKAFASSFRWDYSNPGYLDALKHLTDLKEEGKIKTVALTNFDTERLHIILENGIPVVSNQMVDAWGGWSLFQVLLQTLKRVASKHGVTIPTVAVRYILDQQSVAGSMVGVRLGLAEHIQDTNAVFSLALDEEDINEITEMQSQTTRNNLAFLLSKLKMMILINVVELTISI
ncbi:hypothetical protein COCNU_02G016370 [Cocos nucifera]|uniref:NADP-dependent oxidoreductase domain-containing protein n=1 Tax=Cocos nucifera TaxID=13894 RepID=A0A8K0MY19_COCNU|nr:hypothetical protein COCNU_02G016370 [Cocos nucifera]